MIGLKRFIRSGFVISLGGHLGILVLFLLLVALSSMGSRQPDPPKPPDAMVVDIVPPAEAPQAESNPSDVKPNVKPDEVPRPEGTPSDLPTSGTKVATKPDSANPAVQPQPPKATPQQQRPQPRPTPQHDAEQTSPQPQTSLPPMPQSETAQAPMAQPDPAKTQASKAPPSPPQPDTEETPDSPEAVETFARLALLGGRLGGGFEAPAIDSPEVAHDFTLQFRERVSSCSVLPAGMSPHDRVAISVHVSLNLDGTLAQPPRANGTIRSPQEEALMQSATNALEKCQPYTMLPADKYQAWKALDLIFSPLTFPGG